MTNKRGALLFLALWLAAGAALAQVPDARRAHYNYLVYCRGCHLPDARGIAGKVPQIKGYVGNFLKVEGGREFLVRVPGAANAALDDAQLAELLNWMIGEFAGSSMPVHFQPYSAEEVARLRRHPMNEVRQARAALVARIDSLQPRPAR